MTPCVRVRKNGNETNVTDCVLQYRLCVCVCVCVKMENSGARLCKSERGRTLCGIVFRMAQRRTYVCAGTAMCVCMCEGEKATAACALYTAGGEAGRL